MYDCLFSSPSVQLELLHSKFHLCSAATRGLLLSSYVKFANLFPEIKPQIQEVCDSCELLSDLRIRLTHAFLAIP